VRERVRKEIGEFNGFPDLSMRIIICTCIGWKRCNKIKTI